MWKKQDLCDAELGVRNVKAVEIERSATSETGKDGELNEKEYKTENLCVHLWALCYYIQSRVEEAGMFFFPPAQTVTQRDSLNQQQTE